MNTRILGTALIALMLAGCVPTTDVQTKPARLSQGELDRAKRLLVQGFKDPESAKYRNIRTYRTGMGDDVVCGEVNGKNSFGAYVGYKPFYIRLTGAQIRVTHVDDGDLPFAKVACDKAAGGAIPVNEAEVKARQ